MLALCLMLATAPLADDPAFQDGVRLYEQVDLDGALGRFNAALASPGTDAERAVVHAWIALCHGQLGRKDAAAASFRAAVALDPAVKLPALAPPEVEALLEEAREENKPAVAPPVEVTPPIDPVAAETPPVVTPESAPPPIAAMVVGGSGIALLLAGGATFAIGLDTMFRQAPEAEFNDEGRALVDLAAIEYAVAGGLAGLGVVGLGAAAMFALE